MLNFAIIVPSRFCLRERIPEPVGLTRIALRINLWYLNKISREIISLSIVLCSFIDNIGSRFREDFGKFYGIFTFLFFGHFSIRR